MIDDLDRPLGMDRQPPPKRGGRMRSVLIAVAVVGVGGVLAAAYFGRNGGDRGSVGGEPQAVAPIQPLAPHPAPAVVAGPAPKENAAAAPQSQQVVIENGVKVVRGGAAATSPMIIQVPRQPGGAALAPAPDRRLVEKSRYGLLPRRGRDGTKPADVYARPLAMQPQIQPGTPRIALLVGGMGIDPAATKKAIHKLPPEVSLAFAPYGAKVKQLAAEARAAGHEIFLQSPMEPFDMRNAPGPHVLQVGDSERELDDLHWQMGRIVGYVGLVNFLGGRFTADQGATTTLMSELAKRGLDFVDDGSSPQSLTWQIARRQNVDFIKANLRIDLSTQPAQIDLALSRLERMAEDKGIAVGFAAGLPGAVNRIAGYAAQLKRDGVALVPVSAAIRAENQVKNVRR